MKKIKLFHSYIYIKNSRNIKNINNKLYDSCNNFILGLLNIPQENELYKILIQKNLISNRLSKKNIPIHSYYNKNNAKVYVEVDCEKILQYIRNNQVIPYKQELFMLLKQNYLHILDDNKNIFDVMCLNKYYRKDIAKMEHIHYQHINPYILTIFNLSFNMKTYCITEQSHKNSKINTNTGHLFVCDNLEYTISAFYNMLKERPLKTIIISKYKNVWLNYFKQKQIYNTNIVICGANNINYDKYDRIIYDNIDIPVNLNSKNNWYICENVNEISTLHLKKILKLYLNIDILHIDETVLYSLSKIIYYKNFMEYFYKTKSININYYNLNNYHIPKFEPVLLQKDEIPLLKDHCCVCYRQFTIDSLCKTSCQPKSHYFCEQCITTVLSTSASCPACRQKIDNTKIKKIIDNPSELINENVNKNMSNLLIKLFNKNKDIIICISGNKYLKFIKNICTILSKDFKIINNKVNLIKNIISKTISIINLNNFEYNISKLAKKKKLYVFSINNNKNDINNFLINLKQSYEVINCDLLS